MKALKRLHPAPAAADRPGATTQVDEFERLRRLDSENAKLRELVRHCAVHVNCGYEQMNAEQKSLYNAVIGRRAPASALRIAGVATPNTGWRSCEFCGCRTNATERVCCRRGCRNHRRRCDTPL